MAMPRGVNVFISYSRKNKDKPFFTELVNRLRPLKNSKLIRDIFYDSQINAGSEWRADILAKLSEADVVLLLISPSFQQSTYCQDEMNKAMSRDDCLVIPVIAREVDWPGARYMSLQVLPRSAKPLQKYRPQTGGWVEVTEGIRRSIRAWRTAVPVDRFAPEPKPYSAVSSQIRRSLREAKSVSILSRTGVGWHRDYGDVLEPLLKSSRILVLNPDSDAFRWKSDAKSWGNVRGRTPIEYQQVAKEQISKFVDHKALVRVLDAVVPIVLVIAEHKRNHQRTIYVSYPNDCAPYQGPPVFRVTSRQRESYRYFLDAFDTLWNRYGSPRV